MHGDEVCFFYLVVSLVPISNKNGVITSWVWEWDWDSGPAEDFNGSKATSSLVKGKRWEVVETSNLVLHLECVGEVLAWWDGACGAVNSILV